MTEAVEDGMKVSEFRADDSSFPCVHPPRRSWLSDSTMPGVAPAPVQSLVELDTLDEPVSMGVMLELVLESFEREAQLMVPVELLLSRLWQLS